LSTQSSGLLGSFDELNGVVTSKSYRLKKGMPNVSAEDSQKDGLLAVVMPEDATMYGSAPEISLVTGDVEDFQACMPELAMDRSQDIANDSTMDSFVKTIDRDTIKDVKLVDPDLVDYYHDEE
jgi:hypothetical protein